MFMFYLAMNFGRQEANLWHHQHVPLLRKLHLTDNIENNNSTGGALLSPMASFSVNL